MRKLNLEKKNWWDAREEWYNSRNLNPREGEMDAMKSFKPKNKSENESMNENVSKKKWWKTDDMEIL